LEYQLNIYVDGNTFFNTGWLAVQAVRDAELDLEKAREELASHDEG